MKILFFIDSLRSGGKERRLAELLCYLKANTDFEMCLVLTEDVVNYKYVKDLQIPIIVLNRRFTRYDPSLLFRFLNIAKEFKPDIVHSWGMMTTGYAILTKIILKPILFANLIADAKRYDRSVMSSIFWALDFKYADLILGNSMAGFRSYGLQNNKKIRLIYNGVRFERFTTSPNINQLRGELNIDTPYVAIMVASTSHNKDYDLLLDTAKYLLSVRSDITFIGVGGGKELERLKERIRIEKIENVKLIGKRTDVENLIAIADLGLLFTYSEGISNSIIEYMAMEKPVITTDICGGSSEIVLDGESGYIIERNIKYLANKINELLDKPELRMRLGKRGREIIQQKFSIERMGQAYTMLYKKHAKFS